MKRFCTRRQEPKVIVNRKNYGNIREIPPDEGSSLLQFAAAISVFFSQLGMGAMISWSSPSLQYLMSEKSGIPLTLGQGAWMTSLSSIGCVIGYLIIPLIMDRLGRKYTLLIFAGPQIISWILIILAKNYKILYIARIFGGVGYSCIGLISVYLGEIAETKIRGMLSILMVVSSDLGMFMVATMGAYLSYNTMNLVLLPIPVIYFLSFIFMPESPYFYLMQGRDEEALKSLMKLRGVKNPETLRSEIERMRISDEDQEPRKNIWRDLFCIGSNRKGFFVVILAYLTSMISGSLVVIAYAQQIFEYSGFSLTPAHSFMIVSAVKIFAGLSASYLVERVGRKILYLLSGISSAFALGFVGLSFFLKFHFQINTILINWWPLAGLIIFELASSSGVNSLPFVLGGELFPVGVKKLAVTLIFVASSATTFGIELTFPILSEALGIYASFFIFGAFCLSGTLFVFYIMPETKGRSLEEIQYLLNLKVNEDSGVRLRLLSGEINKYGV